MRHRSILAGAVVLGLLCSWGLEAQQSDSSVSNNTNLPTSSQSAAGTVPRLIKFAGEINPQITQITQITQTGQSGGGKNAAPALFGVTFSLYELQEGGSPLWSESQKVQVDEQGHYSVFLGATQPEGLPLDLFTSGKALWLGTQAQLPGQAEQARVLLVAVPYSLKSSDADTLGGLPASAYLLATANQTGLGTSTAATTNASGSSGKGATSKETALIATTAVTPNYSSTGTTNYIPVFSDNLGDTTNSVMYQSSGNIGLGTTNPKAPVHVYSSGSTNATLPGFLFQRPDAKAETHFQHYYPGISYVSQNMYRDVGGLWYLDGVGNPGMAMILSTNTGIEPANINFLTLSTGGATLPTKVMVIQSSGSVGIGTTTPTGMLEVNGTAKFDGLISFASGQTFTGSGAGLTNLTAANISAGTAGISITGNAATSTTAASATTAGTATTAATATTAGNAADLGGVVATNYARLDIGNSFTGTQTLSGSLSATSTNLTASVTGTNSGGGSGGVFVGGWQAGHWGSPGVAGYGGQANGGSGFLSGPGGSFTGGYSSVGNVGGDGVDAIGGTSATGNSGNGVVGAGAGTTAASGSAGAGIIGLGGTATMSALQGGAGVLGTGGASSAAASSGVGGVGGYFTGGGDASSQGGDGLYAVGGSGAAASTNGMAGRFEGNGAEAVLGDPGCLSGFAGIGFVKTVTPGNLLSNCTNYSMLGNGTDTMINAANGDIFFRQANVTQMVIATYGLVGIGTLTPGAVLEINESASLSGAAILVGRNNGSKVFRVDYTGQVFADGGYQTSGADFAESVAVHGKRSQYEPGDVLEIDPTADRHLALSHHAYSTLVAGIYSTKPGVLATPHTMDDPAIKHSEVPLAVVGIVPCKVSAENGPIGRGDLLVTSSRPGYAMKGTDRSQMLGALVGKALEPLPKGTGVIQVLVTLQ